MSKIFRTSTLMKLPVFLCLVAIIYQSPEAMAQTYSKTFILKGQDGGKFRLKAYLRHATGAKKNRIKVSVSSKSNSEKVLSSSKQPDSKLD